MHQETGGVWGSLQQEPLNFGPGNDLVILLPSPLPPTLLKPNEGAACAPQVTPQPPRLSLGPSRTLQRSKSQARARDGTLLHLLRWPLGFRLMAAPDCLQEIWGSLRRVWRNSTHNPSPRPERSGAEGTHLHGRAAARN